jgi:ribonuclease-3
MTNLTKLKKLFKNQALFEQALTHKSWINENPNLRETNERLEFLGDAVLELVISKALYLQFPDKPEGYLTALRANLVNTTNLAKQATEIEVGKAIFLSKGEEDGGGRSNKSLLANTMEALIGALFLDQGFKVAQNFIHESILANLDQKLTEPLKDAKSRLQEQVQAKSLPTPKYSVVTESGPDHNKSFEVEVVVGQSLMGKGKGNSKSEAEQKAAENALAKKGLI